MLLLFLWKHWRDYVVPSKESNHKKNGRSTKHEARRNPLQYPQKEMEGKKKLVFGFGGEK